MSFTESLEAMDIIVFAAAAFVFAFLAAWCASPKLRAWIERPKYRFQQDVQRYDTRNSEVRR